MKIVIIGDGKVGYKLAKQLSVENYDVVMIDSNEKKLKYAVDRLDIACVTGDAADAEVQREADVPHADLVIACTSADECNMLSCLIARRLGARHTIARVRNPIYFKQIGLLKEDLHLSMAVNPELIVADEISRLLLFPDASKIETFVKGRVELIEYAIPEDSKLIGVTLANMYARFQIKLLVCAVEHGGDVLIPDGDYEISKGDRLHIAVSHIEMERFFRMFGKHRGKIRKVIICGGGRVSYYLATQLCKLGMQVKIIERRSDRHGRGEYYHGAFRQEPGRFEDHCKDQRGPAGKHGGRFRDRQHRVGQNGYCGCHPELCARQKELPGKRQRGDPLPACGRESRGAGVYHQICDNLYGDPA